MKGGPQFTHISYDDYRILKANLFDGGKRTVRDRMVPYTVFMDPQLGRVGMTETEAKKTGKKIRVASMPMTSVARALEMDETRGLMKAIVDAETEEILGATVLGIEGGEVMAVLQMAMMGHLKYSVLHDAVFAHPTLAESLNNLFLHFDDENNQRVKPSRSLYLQTVEPTVHAKVIGGMPRFSRAYVGPENDGGPEQCFSADPKPASRPP